MALGIAGYIGFSLVRELVAYAAHKENLRRMWRFEERAAALSMPYTTILLIICCAVFFYRVGEQEYGAGGLLATGSVALWAVGIFLFKFGSLGNLLLQLGLFCALTLWNMMRPPPK